MSLLCWIQYHNYYHDYSKQKIPQLLSHWQPKCNWTDQVHDNWQPPHIDDTLAHMCAQGYTLKDNKEQIIYLFHNSIMKNANQCIEKENIYIFWVNFFHLS